MRGGLPYGISLAPFPKPRTRTSCSRLAVMVASRRGSLDRTFEPPVMPYPSLTLQLTQLSRAVAAAVPHSLRMPSCFLPCRTGVDELRVVHVVCDPRTLQWQTSLGVTSSGRPISLSSLDLGLGPAAGGGNYGGVEVTLQVRVCVRVCVRVYKISRPRARPQRTFSGGCVQASEVLWEDLHQRFVLVMFERERLR